MEQLRKVMNHVLDVLAGGSFLVMVLLTCWQVFTRYILKNPSSWSEELVSYMFGWMSLFGASLVVGERGHMNIPLLVDRLGAGARKGLAVFAEVVACLFAGVILLYGGWQITNLAMGQMTSSLGIPIGIFYIVLPVSGVLNIVYTILNIIGILNGTIRTSPENEAMRDADTEVARAVRNGTAPQAASNAAQGARSGAAPQAGNKPAQGARSGSVPQAGNKPAQGARSDTAPQAENKTAPRTESGTPQSAASTDKSHKEV